MFMSSVTEINTCCDGNQETTVASTRFASLGSTQCVLGHESESESAVFDNSAFERHLANDVLIILGTALG